MGEAELQEHSPKQVAYFPEREGVSCPNPLKNAR